jgi:competence protein ComEC
MIAKHKGEIPVVVLLLPFLAGISGGLLYQGNSSIPFIALVFLSVLFTCLNIWYTPLKVYKMRWLGGVLISLITLLLGFVITSHHNELNDPNHFSMQPAQQFVAVITSEPKVKDNLVRFTADVKVNINKGKVTKTGGTILITIKDEPAKNMFYGEEILIPAKYAPIDPPFNPGEFNYKKYLANKNVHYQVFLFPGQYKIIAAGKANPVIAYALRTRQNLVDKLKHNMQDTTAIAVASTLILGYKADLSNDVLQAYSKTGTIHILSVSGGHVAIIYILLGWALSFLNGTQRGRVLKAFIIITLVWVYALLTGFSPAVCRAAVMISLVISGKTYSRYINSLNLLAVSAFALLFYDPFLITDVGFQHVYLTVESIFKYLKINMIKFYENYGVLNRCL